MFLSKVIEINISRSSSIKFFMLIVKTLLFVNDLQYLIINISRLMKN